MLDKLMTEVLTCPYHLDDKLIFRLKEIECSICRRIFPIETYGEIQVPNFLIEVSGHDWSRGYRDNNTSLINVFQGDGVQSTCNDRKDIVLDIGCGESARGDINIDCYLPKKLPKNFILANVEFLPIKNKSVDIVSSYYNLEHLINPALFISRASNVAKKKVEILTDNSDWIGDFLFRILGSGRTFHDEHYYKWSQEYMRNLIKRLGYSQYEVSCLNLSKSFIVKLLSIFGVLPRIGPIFYRDLKASIHLTGSIDD